MKAKAILAVAVLALLTTAACEGPVGPQGPTGPEGQKGKQGERGPAIGMAYSYSGNLNESGYAEINTGHDSLDAESVLFSCWIGPNAGKWYNIGLDTINLAGQIYQTSCQLLRRNGSGPDGQNEWYVVIAGGGEHWNYKIALVIVEQRQTP